ncbi:HU family DNA-binding protein [Thermosulfurimonas dismutans]|uniref:Uncharacterized protein n=1 Tax=Thermosulfurimonas dismutans TaxID=999894 RepID=A0A179D1Q9_9BACT|nr:HU family DNA-binding protein [Thermosulfurimonas dismutans]OAQ20004.1 hypothetical protein TDIS_1915 [Thermosulfurimonas dismutans]
MKLLELSRRLAQKTNLSRRQSHIFLKILLKELIAGLREKRRLTLRNFGSLEIRKTSQGWRIIFRASQRILEKLNK